MYSPIATLPFPEAASAWFDDHCVYIRPNTQRSYRQYIKTLGLFLHQMPICEIRPGTIRAYQKWRSTTACALRANAECVVLQMILKEARLWKPLAPTYRPLPVVRRKVRQNMSDAEEARLLRACTAKPQWMLAGHCLIVMMNTSMGFGELRFVRREDVALNVDHPYVIVNGGSKNDYRKRSITLNRVALESIRWIVHRWEDLGGTEAAQYILPHRSVRGSGTQFHVPMGYINTAARAILNEAGLSHLVPYDMRSHFITKILSDPECSDQVYAELVGHSPKDVQMRMRYSKQRLEKKASITDKLCPPLPEKKPVQAEREAPRLLLFPGGRQG